MGRRLGARLIDGLLIGMVANIVVRVVVGTPEVRLTRDPVTGQVSGLAQALGSLAASSAIQLLLFGVYEVAMIALLGATLGKKVLGLRVVRLQDGRVPGWGPAILRWLVPLGAGIVSCGLGAVLVYLSPFWDGARRKQGWHDKAAGTLVIRA
jgi:uncharacterized RDD family membrane protein YckC